jgi:predicted Fe-S protein YdhL (DUF1289 family)
MLDQCQSYHHKYAVEFRKKHPQTASDLAAASMQEKEPGGQQKHATPRLGGTYACDVVGCKRDASNADALAVAKCMTCDVELCFSCKVQLPGLQLLSSLNAEADAPTCPGCSEVRLRDVAEWQQLTEEERSAICEHARKVHDGMLANRLARRQSTGLPAALAGSPKNGGGGPSPPRERRPHGTPTTSAFAEGTLVYRSRDSRLGRVMEVNDATMKVAWMPSSKGFAPPADSEELESFVVGSNTLEALESSMLVPASGKRKLIVYGLPSHVCFGVCGIGQNGFGVRVDVKGGESFRIGSQCTMNTTISAMSPTWLTSVTFCGLVHSCPTMACALVLSSASQLHPHGVLTAIPLSSLSLATETEPPSLPTTLATLQRVRYFHVTGFHVLASH